MRVALFTESYRPVINGVSRAVDTLAGTLERKGHTAMVYAPRSRDTPDREAGVRRFPSYCFPGVPEYPLALPFSLSLSREFAALQFDIVHVQTPFALGFSGLWLARRNRVPVLAHMHTLYVEYAHYFPLTPLPLTRVLMRFLIRWFYNRVDAVVTPTPSVRDLALSYGITRPIHVAPTGVPPPPALDPVEGRKTFGLPLDDPVLLYTGRIAREKNTTLLLEAFRHILQQAPTARLLILGGGPGRQEAEERAGDLGIMDRVVFAGFRPYADVMQANAAADLFLFPSVTDTQALSVVEAMSCGVPPIVVDAFGPADLVENGISGRVVPAEAEAMAAAAVALLADPAERRRLAAGARVRAGELSSDASVDTLLKVYESVLPGVSTAV